MAQQSIHVWAGTSDKTEEQFYKYFDQSKFLKNNQDLNLRCQFCKDLNLQNAYDEDWITIYHGRKRVSIQAMIEELPVWNDQAEVEIYQACIQKGVSTANAIFSYAADELTIENQKATNNGLQYIGRFNIPA
ncbi:hypothetical protein HDF26_001074 [Pedobacter cryoconitis]|uniref:Immunity protein 22 of polymorphic toxin system n=1 Tax=Pedobacter cryoconitis TaxID=188932 RepID=A0A7W8ZR31_9SPHI|nr:immunity 22 family protein [Pedobacter cryoconitis]MBB5638460.1 hypothetical protein [Pedobacter cryoconitis]MBB6270647.1 hypothetical protein [Pedobacter cryoconitis]